MYLKLKQHPFFMFIGRFSKVFQKFKRIPIMLHFRYFFKEIKTQTSSLILFGARQEFFFKKTTGMQAKKIFCLSLLRKRDTFLPSSAKRKKVSIL